MFIFGVVNNTNIYMKRFIASWIFICFLFVGKAQKMEECFIRMPDDLVFQLEEAWRKDLVDLYKSGKPAALENTMQGMSVLIKLSDNYLLLQSTESSTVELKLLSLINNTHIICMIETVYAPIADSRISFYSTGWQQLPSDNIFIPVDESWFWKEHASSQEYLPQSEVFLLKYSLSDENEILTAEYMTPLFLDDENQQQMNPFLKSEPKTYKWKSGRFE